MNLNNFHYVAVLLDQLYGMELDDEDLEELGLIAWEHIGNKRSRLYTYKTCINQTDNSIQLPCNASSIEAVTASYEDWNRVTNYSLNGDNRSAYIESYIESYKEFPSKYYIPGKLLDYEQVGDTIYFTKNYGIINIQPYSLNSNLIYMKLYRKVGSFKFDENKLELLEAVIDFISDIKYTNLQGITEQEFLRNLKAK